MFDPYRTWLGIPPDRRPPTHYDLLGVSPKETDPDVLKNAHLMRMGHLRKYQNGPNSEDCVRIMREVSAAAEILLAPQQYKRENAPIRSISTTNVAAAKVSSRRDPRARREADRNIGGSFTSDHNWFFAKSRSMSSALLVVGTASAIVLGVMFVTLWLALPRVVSSHPAEGAVELNPIDNLPKVITNSIGMSFVLIPPGTFERGSSQQEAKEAYHVDQMFYKESTQDWFDSEVPRHKVRLSKPFYFSKYEVTQEEWEKVMETRPWSGKPFGAVGKHCPASWINWDEAVSFCWRLTQQERQTGRLSPIDEYRLPTEAEWEYACRGGTSTSFCFGDDKAMLREYSWFHDNTRGAGEPYEHEVGGKTPNAWGLHDMHGNVWEWCNDWSQRDYYRFSPQVDPFGPSSGELRVMRGGAYCDPPSRIRSAYRGAYPAQSRLGNIGFRPARTCLQPE